MYTDTTPIGGVMALSKITRKRQVVIPEEICRMMGANVGDYVEFVQRNDEIIIKPKKLVDADVITWQTLGKQTPPVQTQQDRLAMLRALEGNADDESGDIPLEKIKAARTTSDRIPKFD